MPVSTCREDLWIKLKESNFSWDRKNYFGPKVSKIGSIIIIDHRIDYSEQGVLSERLMAHTQEINWPEFPPPPTAGFSIYIFSKWN